MTVGHSDRGDSSSQVYLGLRQDNENCDVVRQEVRHKDSPSFLYTSSSHRTNLWWRMNSFSPRRRGQHSK